MISAIDPNPELRLSPENGNVAFASTDMNWCFTLRSFAQMYADTYGNLRIFLVSQRVNWSIKDLLMSSRLQIACGVTSTSKTEVLLANKLTRSLSVPLFISF